MGAYNINGAATLVGGQPEDVSQVLSNFQAIQAIINGGIDASNFAAGTIFDPTKIAAGNVNSSVNLMGPLLGIGLNAPVYPVDGLLTLDTQAANPTRVVAYHLRATAAPSAAPIVLTDYHGIDLVLDASVANINADTRLYAFESNAQYSGAGTVNQLVPVYAFANNIGGGTAQEVRTHRIALQNTGTVTNWYGTRIEAMIGVGTVTNFYGHYVEDQTAHVTGNFYAFFSEAGRHSFGGPLFLTSSVGSPGGANRYIGDGGNAGTWWINAGTGWETVLAVNDVNILQITGTQVTVNKPLSVVGPIIMTGSPGGQGAAVRYLGAAATSGSWYINAATGWETILAVAEATQVTITQGGLGFYGVAPVAQAAAIAAPAGGATVDTQARTAIGLLITALHNLGLTG